MASVSSIITYSVLNQSLSSQAISFKAAIIDQLSGTFPNPSFNDNARTTLVGAGYTVDYYSPDQVTVELFRSLPSKGYSLLILRAHSTGWVSGSAITIFTSELWQPDRYVYEQLTGTVQKARLSNNQTLYFVIHWGFVRDVMKGMFSNSLIIMMGCTGLKDSDMAQAFITKGAQVYISWDKSVTADRTDKATIALLRSLAQGKTLREAVSIAMADAGPDPIYDGRLGYYPYDQGGLTLSRPNTPSMMLNVQIRLELLFPYYKKF